MSTDVTVIVPVHNTSQGVLVGLESLRAQTMPRARFEVVYVNDGSTDDTGDLLDAELADEENFSVVHIENSGWPGRPRNIGVDRARGEYVFFMDDDDRLGPEALERLVAKARQDAADIVIGRVCGIGRTAPRQIFQKPMSGGDIRTDHVLLTTLTVQKLFRTEFLRANGLRFEEGRVRLEDHMFMLHAYLCTSAVSVVHDYTCYYWIRNKDFGNISFQPPDPADYLGSVERIIDIVEDSTEPGPFQDRLLAHWYRSKLLGRMQGRKYLRQSAESARELHAVAHSLVSRRVPERLDAKLNAFTRLRATALRTGRPELVRRVAEFEEDLAHTTTVTGFRWAGDKLFVKVEAVLTRAGDGRPLEFVRDGESVRWNLPAELTEVESVRTAAEITKQLKKLRLRVFARNNRNGADVTVPVEFTATEVPAGADRFTLTLTGTVELDIPRGNLGTPMAGRWWFLSRVDLAGTSSDHRLGPLRGPAADSGRTPAFVDLPGAASVLVTPFYNAKDQLVLTVDDAWQALGQAVREAERTTVVDRGGLLSLRIPLALRVGEQQVTFPLQLRGPQHTVEGTVSVRAEPSTGDAPRAMLTAEVAGLPRHGHWEVSVGSARQPVPLGLWLSRHFGRWSVRAPGPSRTRLLASRTYRALRRRAGRVVRRIGLR